MTPLAEPDLMNPPNAAVRIVVIAPTFDNARTLLGVLDGARATGLPIVVVNDGSTDDTAAVLATVIEHVAVVTHPTNQGKAAAIKSGFAWAIAYGYTHAATIDTDAQHDPADLIALVALAMKSPAALVLGVRKTEITGYPRKSRVGRWAANTLVRWEGGPRVADSQCGLRIYPLATIPNLPVRSGRYGYETEVLTRAGWAGVPVVEAPVACVYAIDGGRVSHFRPWVDSLRAAGLHLRLLFVALLRWLNPREAWHAARSDPKERGRFAGAAAIGVFIGNLPLFGLHTVLCVLAAKKLKLQPLAVIAGSHISTPPIGPFLIALQIAVGHLIVHGHFNVPADLSPSKIGYLACLRRVALEWTVGGVACGLVLGAVAFVVIQLILRYLPHLHGHGAAAVTDTATGSAARATAPAAAHASGSPQ